jgi:type IV secretory pathway TraG/TraD family ATPase VirD4
MVKQTKTVDSNPLAPLVEVAKPFMSPDFLPLWGILALWAMLSMFGKKKQKGKLAEARVATDAEIAAGVKRAIAMIKNPSIKKSALLIPEPIGCPFPTPDNIDEFKGRLTPLIDITRGTLVLGNQGSGKTENMLKQLFKSGITQNFGGMILDRKYPDLAKEIIPFAIEHGYSVRVFAPGHEESGVCNILTAIADEHDDISASQIITTIRKNLKGKDERRDAFFDGGGEGMICGAMLLAKMIGRLCGNPEVADLLLVDEIISMPNLIERLEANRATIPHGAYRSFGQYIKARSKEESNNTESGLQSTAASILKPLISNKFVECISGTSDFPGFDKEKPFWIGEKELVIFGVNEDLHEVVTPLIIPIIEQVGRYNLSPTRKRNLPIIIGLDEFASFLLSIVVDDWLPVKRSAGAAVIIGIQYLAQLIDLYGEQGAKKVLGCANKFFFNPGSVENAEPVSKEMGEQEVVIGGNSKSRTAGRQSSTSDSENEQPQSVRLFDALALKQFAVGTCIVEGAAVSTGKGVDERVGLPYKRRFTRLDDECDEQEEFNSKAYEAIVQSVIAKKKKDNINDEDIDLASKSAEYRKLIEEYLPMGVKNKSKTTKSKAAKYVDLKELLAMADHECWELKGDRTNRPIPIPNDWTGKITLEKLEKALQAGDIEVLNKGGIFL